MAGRTKKKAIKYVPLELPGLKEHLTLIQVLMQTWLQVSIVKTLTMEKALKRNNGSIKELG